jgi:hypothetical protein
MVFVKIDTTLGTKQPVSAPDSWSVREGEKIGYAWSAL